MKATNTQRFILFPKLSTSSHFPNLYVTLKNLGKKNKEIITDEIINYMINYK